MIHKKGSKVHWGFLFVLGGMVIFVFLNDIHGVEQIVYLTVAVANGSLMDLVLTTKA